MGGPRVRPAECDAVFVAGNIRGVMMAAFAPTSTIMRIFGCDEEEAERFKSSAFGDLQMVKTAIAQAKHRMRPGT